jgi:hypothetical protein
VFTVTTAARTVPHDVEVASVAEPVKLGPYKVGEGPSVNDLIVSMIGAHPNGLPRRTVIDRMVEMKETSSKDPRGLMAQYIRALTNRGFLKEENGRMTLGEKTWVNTGDTKAAPAR